MTTTPEPLNRATIKVPSTTFGQPPQLIPGCFRSMSNKRLHLTSRERLRTCTAVSVEYEDAMFLGEVVACTQDLDDRWHVEVEVEQILTGLQSLMNLRAHLLGESTPASVGRMPALAGRY